ncbi:hypothetical protein SEA_LUCKYSOCKE_200 [Streptomyces phage LuckySocke]|jgi:hypothetical protein|nr:hypothetical protein SEA_LUCKYSOCKE_200 [Streptomyces phage LuckySocke]
MVELAYRLTTKHNGSVKGTNAMLEYATVAPLDIRTGDAFLVNGVNWTADTDAEFVRSAGTTQVRATDNFGNVRFVELTEDTYEIAYYAEYAAV